MRNYKHKALGELAAELRSGLVRLRKGYLDSAEELLELICPEQNYPYEFIVYRITGYRPDSPGGETTLIPGRVVRHDLLRMMLDISESFELYTADYDEMVYDTSALARRFHVSTKTVQRWRKRGLAARRLIFPDGRRRIGFLESSLRSFQADNKQQLRRSSAFTHLTAVERKYILRRAARMARVSEATLSDIARRLARRTGRAVETVRYTIRKHDNEHPERAIFPKLLQGLTDTDKQAIYRGFLKGVSVPVLAEQYHRTRGSIYRIVTEMRARSLLQREIPFIFNPEFEASDADEKILADNYVPQAQDDKEDLPDRAGVRVKPPSDLPAYLRSLYEVPLLDADQERDLFRRYNYLKYKADRLRRKIDFNRVLAQDVKEIEALLLRANVVKNRIVRANLRLVVSIAKKHTGGPLSLFELISDGNVSLMRAVEKFDYARGFRFSTYASWAIMRNFARSVPKERYQLDRFSTGHEEVLDIAAGLRSYNPQEIDSLELRDSIDTLLEHLSPRERTILIDHYGLEETGSQKTFDQLGQQLGISKERVRQIEIQALEKLRDIADTPEG